MTIPEAHAKIDAAIVDMATMPGWRPPTCQAGCGACCSEPVYATLEEAAHLAERVLALPPEELAAVRAAAAEWLARFFAAGLGTVRRPDVIAYRRAKLRCPLLDKTQRCRLYADRPGECRWHLAVGPRGLCEDTAKRRDQQFVRNAVPHGAAAALRDAAGSATLVIDHLGVLLGEALLRRAVPSAARSELPRAR